MPCKILHHPPPLPFLYKSHHDGSPLRNSLKSPSQLIFPKEKQREQKRKKSATLCKKKEQSCNMCIMATWVGYGIICSYNMILKVPNPRWKPKLMFK
jgi:hypothetical protein